MLKNQNQKEARALENSRLRFYWPEYRALMAGHLVARTTIMTIEPMIKHRFEANSLVPRPHDRPHNANLGNDKVIENVMKIAHQILYSKAM